jgi:hypothetical protein
MVAIDGQACHTMQCSDFVSVRESPFPLLSVNRCARSLCRLL